MKPAHHYLPLSIIIAPAHHYCPCPPLPPLPTHSAADPNTFQIFFLKTEVIIRSSFVHIRFLNSCDITYIQCWDEHRNIKTIHFTFLFYFARIEIHQSVLDK